MPNCSVCGTSAKTLGELRRHYTAAGHPMKKSKKSQRGKDTAPELGGEERLIVNAVALFQSAGTEPDEDARVLGYLISRYAPSLLDGGAVSAEDEE